MKYRENTGETEAGLSGQERRNTPETLTINRMRNCAAAAAWAACSATALVLPTLARADENLMRENAGTTLPVQHEMHVKKQQPDDCHHKNAVALEMGQSFLGSARALHFNYDRLLTQLGQEWSLDFSQGLTAEFGKFEGEKGQKVYVLPVGVELTYETTRFPLGVTMGAAVGAGISHVEADSVESGHQPAHGGTKFNPFMVVENSVKVFFPAKKSLSFSLGLTGNVIIPKAGRWEPGLYGVVGGLWRF